MKIKNLKLKINQYNLLEVEAKWQKRWEESKIYSPDLDNAKHPFYNLMMFPYPSAEGMHVGNMYGFTGSDVYGRFQRMQGKDVFEPIGLDGFGIHSENYAIKAGNHPVEQAKISEKNYYKQLKSIGNGFDWTHSLETYKPEYYKWTQWLFTALFKAGLAYRKKAPVNFCPSCKTVLADEQVFDGVCERCETEVIKKELEQWFFRITKYANRLLANIPKLDWSEKVKIAQRQWIGRSEGLIINFDGIDVFTTRPETTDGATFLVLSPEHPFVASLLNSKFIHSTSSGQNSKLMEIKDYIEKTRQKTGLPDEVLTKSGVFTGEYVINPLTKKKIPIWIADYVLMGYGTGAIMAVPSEDQRDKEFAQKYKIPIEKTSLSAKPEGQKVVNYHLRDWLISRQRYWGPPIPMIYCPSCAKASAGKENAGWQAVPEKDLPVVLPFVKDYKPLGIHSAGSGQAVKGPLASHPEFYKTRCPKCGMDAKRETDVSDTFLDSAWYFLRYLATEWDDIPFPTKKKMLKPVQHNIGGRTRWLPVNMYIGGAEHSVLHLLYSRFITMVLKDLGFINFEEPFTKFRAHGLIVKDGAKMSKSKGNVVVPDSYIKKFGADTLRTYLMFMGPFSQGGDFRDTGIEGMHRFLRRVWNLVSSIKYPTSAKASAGRQVLSIEGKDTSLALDSLMHKTIKNVTEDIENLNYNTAIARLMEYYNELFSFYTKYKILNTKYCKTLVLLFAPFAPHVSEELCQLLNDKKEFSSIHNSSWPKFDPKFLVKDEFVIVVQVNGKLRGNIKVKNEKLKMKSYIEELAKKDDNVVKHLEAKEIKKVIYIEGKVINFVVV